MPKHIPTQGKEQRICRSGHIATITRVPTRPLIENLQPQDWPGMNNVLTLYSSHRLTGVKHPWTGGRIERMNRTIKGPTVSRYHYKSHEELKKHPHAFLMGYNLTSRLKTLKGKSPYDFIKAVWATGPERFIANPVPASMWD